MGFSWTTFLAQIVNLFVLVWLMKRFLYGPIINTITKRQAYIEGKVRNAEKAARNAERQEAELKKKQAAWQRDRQKRLDAVYEEITALRQEQSERIRLEAEGLRQKMQDDLNREAATRQLEIRNIMVQNFMTLSRRALADLSGLAPMAQTLALFQKKVAALPKAKLKNIRQAVQKIGRITVSSSEALSAAEQKQLTRFLTDLFGEATICYDVRPELILGVEAVIGETILEWNLKTYLDLFDNNLNTALAGLIVRE